MNTASHSLLTRWDAWLARHEARLTLCGAVLAVVLLGVFHQVVASHVTQTHIDRQQARLAAASGAYGVQRDALDVVVNHVVSQAERRWVPRASRSAAAVMR